MQFIVIAHDRPNVLEKRLSVRSQHIAMGDKMRAEGHYHMGVALLNDANEMVGSVMIVEFPTRDAVDAWLKVEPYILNKVWDRYEVIPCNIGPTFLK